MGNIQVMDQTALIKVGDDDAVACAFKPFQAGFEGSQVNSGFSGSLVAGTTSTP